MLAILRIGDERQVAPTRFVDRRYAADNERSVPHHAASDVPRQLLERVPAQDYFFGFLPAASYTPRTSFVRSSLSAAYSTAPSFFSITSV